MSATCEILKIPLHVITKKFKAKNLNEFWVRLRKARGIKLIAEEKSTFEILRAIRQGQAVGFILDQFMGPPVGVKTQFFGYPTGTAAALALFADRTRAPVIPVYNVRQKDGRLRIVFEKPVEFMEQGSRDKNISFMTQVYTNRIEGIVRKYPEQWLWLHKRWKPFRE
jgi:KDO2-lipid IV(A) lauroyltransferase